METNLITFVSNYEEVGKLKVTSFEAANNICRIFIEVAKGNIAYIVRLY